MNGLKKLLAGSLISVFVLFASTSNAVTFPVFDHMDSDTQAEFIADMVDRTEKALRDDGKPDLALKTEQLFAQDKPSDPLSAGLAELESNVGHARVADFDRLAKNPKAQRVQVEDALFVTLKKNGIELSSNAMDGVMNAMARFHEMTHAEFRAQSPSEQRHIVRLFAEIALPDYLFRDALAKKKSTLFGLDDKASANLAEIMSTQFPHSGDQPGFAHVVSDVENNSVKYANVPVFYTVVLYFQKELRKGNEADLRKEVEWSVQLPDGRHVYPDNDYTFWVEPLDSAAYKLEPNLQHLALLLYRCMQTSGMTDGWRAQTVCLEKVAGIRSSSAAPAPPPPPAVAPATTPPPVAPTPPDPRYVVICVQAGLIQLDHDSWNMPVLGGKMVTFQNFIGPYILSVAKPSWLYGIGDQAYARFNPAATGDPASFVFPIPPDQQATPGKCPADYSDFWLWRKH